MLLLLITGVRFDVIVMHATTDVEGVETEFLDAGLGWNNPTCEMDGLIGEHPFYYKLTEDLIVVSLSTGGDVFQGYRETFLSTEKAKIPLTSTTECRKTAGTMDRRYNASGMEKVLYYRIDPDAVGRYEMDDAESIDVIQKEMTNWFNAARQRELRDLAIKLTDAKIETHEVTVQK